mmetsp:Transcript_7123/g.44135  ORF Transcript_7123/g.44135 Transcript_7123/m.44135 type:complete len:87 (-) Transcript_7123:742-1002(-)
MRFRLLGMLFNLVPGDITTVQALHLCGSSVCASTRMMTRVTQWSLHHIIDFARALVDDSTERVWPSTAFAHLKHSAPIAEGCFHVK